MPAEADRLLEIRGGPLDGDRVPQSAVDASGHYYEFVPTDGPIVGIACHDYDAGTDALHYTETARIRNGSAVQ